MNSALQKLVYRRSGSITAASDAGTSASAMNSLAPGRSPRKSMPEKTPTRGTGSEESELTATGRLRAMRNLAQFAIDPAKKMLYITANAAFPDIEATEESA